MNLLSWITKGCVLNWQQTSTKACLDLLIANLENTDSTTSQGAVQGFQMLCSSTASSKQEYNLVNGMFMIFYYNYKNELCCEKRICHNVNNVLIECFHYFLGFFF